MNPFRIKVITRVHSASLKSFSINRRGLYSMILQKSVNKRLFIRNLESKMNISKRFSLRSLSTNFDDDNDVDNVNENPESAKQL